MSASTSRQPAFRVFKREALSPADAQGLQDLFKIFSNETRLLLLDALVRSSELCVNDMADLVGLSPQAVSNQLQQLLARGVVATRREGNQIFYRIHDPCVPRLLDLGACLLKEGRKGGR